jgi:hypothetical protein
MKKILSRASLQLLKQTLRLKGTTRRKFAITRKNE